jgi:hypothetical protein
MSKKSHSSKSDAKPLRSRYAWHLQPAFEREFDRSHWWKELSDSEIKPVAALYELARRHPLVGEMRLKFRHASWYGQELRAPLNGAAKKSMASLAFDDLGHLPRAIHCLCLIGLQSWPKLDWRTQDYWEMSAGKMKGVDCRDDIERCSSITLTAQADTVLKRAFSLKLDRSAFKFMVGAGNIDKNEARVAAVNPNAFDRAMSRLVENLHKKPIPSMEMEEAIARNAVSAYREGHLIISIASDLTSEEAKILLEREYREHHKRSALVNQRGSFSGNWLHLISEFEKAEVSHRNAKSQLFARYRRAMGGISFSAERDVFAKIKKMKRE